MLKDAGASLRSLAATVSAAVTRAGEEVQASCGVPTLLPLPAATAKVTPSLIARETALSRVLLAGPPRLRLATAGCPAAWLAVTQSIPAITPEVLPLPAQSSTRTATSRTPLATP